MELNPQQLEFLENYLNPESETYGNAYRSAIKAKYSEEYAKNIGNRSNKWLSEIVEKTLVTEEEIVEGIKAETTTEKSNDRLKAWELLGKYKKLFSDKVELGVAEGTKIVIERPDGTESKTSQETG